MYGYIYKTTNLINGKIYIGQKKSDKFLFNQYLGSGTKLKSAIKHYGKENFKVELLEECYSKQSLNNREKFYIEKYNSQNSYIGYNIVDGGESGGWNKNYHWFNNGIEEAQCIVCPDNWVSGRLLMTEQQKEKISKSQKGKIVSEKTRDKLRHISHPKGENHYNFGKHLSIETRIKIGKSKENISNETRNKLRESRLGKHLSQETKLKISKNNGSIRLEVKEKISKNNGSKRPEVKEKISKSLKGNIPANKGKVWVTNGNINKFIFPSELDLYINIGYKAGLTRKTS